MHNIVSSRAGSDTVIHLDLLCVLLERENRDKGEELMKCQVPPFDWVREREAMFPQLQLIAAIPNLERKKVGVIIPGHVSLLKEHMQEAKVFVGDSS